MWLYNKKDIYNLYWKEVEHTTHTPHPLKFMVGSKKYPIKIGLAGDNDHQFFTKVNLGTQYNATRCQSCSGTNSNNVIKTILLSFSFTLWIQSCEFSVFAFPVSVNSSIHVAVRTESKGNQYAKPKVKACYISSKIQPMLAPPQGVNAVHRKKSKARHSLVFTSLGLECMLCYNVRVYKCVSSVLRDMLIVIVTIAEGASWCGVWD